MTPAGNTTTHVVVFEKEIKDNNGNVTHFTVYDPKRGESYDIPFDSVMDILHVGVKGSSNGSSYNGSESSSYYGSGSSSYYG